MARVTVSLNSCHYLALLASYSRLEGSNCYGILWIARLYRGYFYPPVCVAFWGLWVDPYIAGSCLHVFLPFSPRLGNASQHSLFSEPFPPFSRCSAVYLGPIWWVNYSTSSVWVYVWVHCHCLGLMIIIVRSIFLPDPLSGNSLLISPRFPLPRWILLI